MNKKLLIALGSLAILANFEASATTCQGKITGMALNYDENTYEVEFSQNKHKYFNLGYTYEYSHEKRWKDGLDAYQTAKLVEITFPGNQSCSVHLANYTPAESFRIVTGGGTGPGPGDDDTCREYYGNELHRIKSGADRAIKLPPSCDL
ncbi:hypothetical protein [Aliikangiella coralliicola]|uniref:Uncharacterized protein n=1 Tax=Aliikangiella coralliicola TaxID=2592383 RepID=A0A545U6G9_9GAMM|nr:hypothetical protein [Aliikangiella coralliicola]TQV85057.1 hypothetical protein FLL46_21965 [Aliikangiella coralliicola]